MVTNGSPEHTATSDRGRTELCMILHDIVVINILALAIYPPVIYGSTGAYIFLCCCKWESWAQERC